MQQRRSKKFLPFLFFLALAIILGACKPMEPAVPLAANEIAGDVPEIVIESAWSRSTPELMEGSGITYMLIKNIGAVDDRLIAAKSDICDVVELHEHKMDSNGVMRMRMIEGGHIDIPANGEVELVPGGLHLMLVNLHEGLKAGTTYTLALKFEKTGEVMIEVPVFDTEPEN